MLRRFSGSAYIKYETSYSRIETAKNTITASLNEFHEAVSHTPRSEGLDNANHRINSRIVLARENLYAWIPSAMQNRNINTSRFEP